MKGTFPMNLYEIPQKDKTNLFPQFKIACMSHGFHCRGKAFFRVIGDGVLQVLQYDNSSRLYNHTIRVGLFSLYGEIEKQWLTAYGCIPRYRLFTLFTQLPKTFYHILKQLEIGVQLVLLENMGFQWLDGVTSQQRLAEAICELDMADMGDIRWNDMLKIAPFLMTGQYGNAQKVLESMICQHELAIASYQKDFEPETSKQLILGVSQDIDAYKLKLGWIQERNTEAIHQYTSYNFAYNRNQTAFCTVT